MKTNIGVVTTDEERKVLAQALGKKGMVSRNDIKEAVDGFIKLLLTGATVQDPTVFKNNEQTSGAEHCLSKGAPHPPEGREAEFIRTGSIRETGSDFNPSRGDESYLFKAKDPQLHQMHTNLLDAIQALENYTWADMEANRK